MRKTLHGLVTFSALLFLLVMFLSCEARPKPAEKAKGFEQASTMTGKTTIRHVVLFRFKKEASKQEIDDAFNVLFAVKDKIPGILSITAGHYESQEGLNKGFNYGFTMDFRDRSAVEIYDSHPEHQKVKEKFIKLLEGGLEGVIAGEIVPF